MNKFFIKLSDLPEDWQELLQKEKLQFNQFEYWLGKGILVSEKYIIVLLKLLGLQVKEQTITSYPNIFRLKVTNRVFQTNECSIAKWQSAFKPDKYLAFTEQILLPIVKRDILLYGPCNWPIRNENDGCFSILFWSSPLDWSSHVPPKEIWGIPTLSFEKVMKRSKTGNFIVDYSSNYVIGEVSTNNLYIYHNICSKNAISELALYKKILESLIFEFSNVLKNTTS